MTKKELIDRLGRDCRLVPRSGIARPESNPGSRGRAAANRGRVARRRIAPAVKAANRSGRRTSRSRTASRRRIAGGSGRG